MNRLVIAAIACLCVALTLKATPTQASYLSTRTYLAANKDHEKGDYHAARKKYEKLLSEKDVAIAAHAATQIAQYYEKGLGAPKDVSLALKYWNMAADSADRDWASTACAHLGLIYSAGIDGELERDRAKAYKYYSRAASLGFDASDSLEHLQSFPDVYVTAHPEEFFAPREDIAPAGIEKAFEYMSQGDNSKASEIFEWHARRGNGQAQYALAVYMRSMGSEKLVRKSVAWTFMSARNGTRQAQREYGQYLITKTIAPTAEGYEWLRRASDQGDGSAENLMGVYRANPVDGTDPDPIAAANHFRKAISMGNSSAAVNLGDIYALGIGVQKDDKKAIELYTQAAAEGDLDARNSLFSRYNIVFSIDEKNAHEKHKKIAQPVIRDGDAPKLDAPKFEMSPMEVFDSISPSVHLVLALEGGKSGGSQGSGVAIGENELVTNCHVVADSEMVGAFVSGKPLEMSRSRENKKADLCFLRSSVSLRPIRSVRSFSDLKIGERVYAVGSPKGLENSLSEGLISGLRNEDGIRYVQTTAPISPGSSGGGLFDSHGRLIGITTFKINKSENLNFAVSTDSFH